MESFAPMLDFRCNGRIFQNDFSGLSVARVQSGDEELLNDQLARCILKLRIGGDIHDALPVVAYMAHNAVVPCEHCAFCKRAV